MSITSLLYRLARLSADVKAVAKGPKALSRRVKNKAVGRAMSKAGFWRRLWK